MTDELEASAALIWTNGRAPKDRPSIVRLTGEALTLSKVPAADIEPVVEAMKRCEPTPGEIVPLSGVTGAEGLDDGAELTVSFKTGPSGAEKRPLTFADRAQRDEFVAALTGALGPSWRRAQRHVSRWSVGFWTLGPTIAIGVAAWLMRLEAVRIVGGQPPANWGKGKLRLVATIAHWLEGLLGPTGVLIAGGVLVVIGLMFFAVAMAWPPKNVVIERAGE